VVLEYIETASGTGYSRLSPRYRIHQIQLIIEDAAVNSFWYRILKTQLQV
jgi:hypothetical protein